MDLEEQFNDVMTDDDFEDFLDVLVSRADDGLIESPQIDELIQESMDDNKEMELANLLSQTDESFQSSQVYLINEPGENFEDFQDDSSGLEGYEDAVLPPESSDAIAIPEAPPLCEFSSALDEAAARLTRFHISTGSKQLDELLDGGVSSKCITEVIGPSASGKTQLALTLCVTSMLPDIKSGKGIAIYIDTEGKFRPDRLSQIGPRFGIKDAKDKVLYTRCHNLDELFADIEMAEEQIKRDPTQHSILIIDSFINFFLLEYPTSSDRDERQKKIVELLKRLKDICHTYDIAVFITNQVRGGLADSEAATGGLALALESSVRLSLSAIEGSSGRMAKICRFNLRDGPENLAYFDISAEGICDLYGISSMGAENEDTNALAIE